MTPSTNAILMDIQWIRTHCSPTDLKMYPVSAAVFADLRHSYQFHFARRAGQLYWPSEVPELNRIVPCFLCKIGNVCLVEDQRCPVEKFEHETIKNMDRLAV